MPNRVVQDSTFESNGLVLPSRLNLRTRTLQGLHSVEFRENRFAVPRRLLAILSIALDFPDADFRARIRAGDEDGAWKELEREGNRIERGGDEMDLAFLVTGTLHDKQRELLQGLLGVYRRLEKDSSLLNDATQIPVPGSIFVGRPTCKSYERIKATLEHEELHREILLAPAIALGTLTAGADIIQNIASTIPIETVLPNIDRKRLASEERSLWSFLASIEGRLVSKKGRVHELWTKTMDTVPDSFPLTLGNFNWFRATSAFVQLTVTIVMDKLRVEQKGEELHVLGQVGEILTELTRNAKREAALDLEGLARAGLIEQSQLPRRQKTDVLW